MKQETKVVEFELKELLGIAFTLLVIGIGTAYGLQVMSDIQTDMTVGSVEYNATGDAITGVAKIPSKLPMIGTIVVAAVIIGIIVRYLWVRFN